MHKFRTLLKIAFLLCFPLLAVGLTPGPFPATPVTTGTSYNFTFQPSTGEPPYSVSVVAGALPAGLTLTGPLVLSGTPTVAGTYPLTFRVTDSISATADVSGTLTVLQLTTTSLSSSVSGTATLQAPVTFTATVTPGSTTGSVTFYNGSAVLGTRSVSSGRATLTTSLLPAGIDKIKAFYTGNASAATSVSSILSQTVATNPQNGFQPPVVYSTGAGASNATFSVTGDFNEDGKTDIAVANFGTSNISIFLGTGTGTFSAPTTVTVGSGPAAIATGDFNGDGHTDLVVANFNSTSNTVSVLLGNGSGGFAAAVDYTTALRGTTRPSNVAVGDLNGDGIPDLAVTNYMTGNIAVLIGTGTGTFGAATTYGVGTDPNSIVIGDFNGDGNADLAVANYGSSNISVLLNQGDGTFGTAVPYSSGAGANGSNSIVTADFNGDGRLDLAVSNGPSNTLGILVGRGDGTFGNAAVVSAVASSTPTVLAMGDFNGDGKLDLITGNFAGPDVSVFMGNGLGGFAAPVSYSVGGSVANGTSGVAVGDFNGDGVSDAFTANYSSGNAGLLLGVASVFTAQPVTLTWFAPDLTTVYQAPQTATQGSGPEFPNFATANPAFNVDFGDSSIEIDSAQTRGAPFDLAGVAFNGLAITNPGTGRIPPFTNVSLSNSNWLDSNGNPFTRSRITFDSTHIYADFRGMVNLVGDGIILQVNQNLSTTTTVLTSTPNPSAIGVTVTLTATVAGGGTGTVSFFLNSVDAANFLGNGTLSGGNASLQVGSLPAGTTSLIAFYNGDATHDVSTSNTVSQVVKTATTTVLTSSQNPSTTAANVTYTATVTPSTATGTVSFTVDGSAFATGGVSSGQATLTTSLLTAGSHSIVATYSGDSGNLSSVTNTLTQIVKTPTTTTISVSANSATFGTAVTMLGTVTGASTGKVAFYNGTTLLDTVDMASGVAGLTTKLLPVGRNKLKAFYLGGSSTFSSTSVFTQTVTVTSLPQNGLLTGVINSGAQSPWGIAQLDFNKDGKMDVVEADFGLPQITVYPGVGDGTLGTPLHFAAPSGPVGVAVGDFDGDGNPDIAVAGSGNNSVGILLGDGAGGIKAPYVAYTAGVGSQPNGIVVADFDGDGNADIAVTNSQSNTISVLFGTGTGTFGTGVIYNVGANPQGIVAGDFNGDGKTDLAVSNAGSSTVSILLNTGSGVFQAAVSYNTLGTSSASVAIGDFNGDGNPDLVTANQSSGDISILLGTGTGTFGTATRFPAGSFATLAAVGDFNGDGKLDVATANQGGGNVSVLFGNGNGSFGPASNYGLGAGGSQPRALIVGDMNGDGVSDLVVTNFSGNNISVLIGVAKIPATVALTSSGTPSALGGSVTLTATASPGIVTGTVTFYNGLIPIGISNVASGVAALTTKLLPAGTNSLSAYYSGDTTYTSAKATIVPQLVNSATVTTLSSLTPVTVGNGPRLIVYGDFNHDGKADIATANQGASSVSVALGNGDGTFQPRTDYFLSATPNGMVAVDLNNDGFQDLVLSTGANLSILLGNSNGTFQAATTTPAGGSPFQLAAGDIDGDGNADLIVPNNGSGGGISIFFGMGDGTFRSFHPTYSTGGNTVSAVVAGDFNGDGFSDIAATANNFGIITLYLGSADGTLTNITALVPDDLPSEIVTGDFNHDGKLDLAVAFTGATSSVSSNIFLGNGDGTFSKKQANTGSTPYMLATADINGDGLIDLVAADGNDGTLYTVLGNGDGTFQAPVSHTAGTLTEAVAVADFNGDGRSDVVVGNNAANTVVIFLGQFPAAGVVVTSSQAPSTVGKSVTFTATLTPSSATGTVIFKDNGVAVGTPQTISGGVASLITSTLTLGTHPITAVYSGDANNAGSTSASFSQVVNQTPTTTSLNASPSPGTEGVQVTLTATVTPNTGNGVPAGNVTFKDAGTPLGAAVSLDGSGVAILNTSTLVHGTHSLTALYNGDVNYVSSTSTAVNENVLLPSSTTLNTSPNPSIVGQTVTLTAIVPAGGGTVAFKDGATDLGTANPDSGGNATVQTTSLTAGVHTLTAAFSGTTQFASSSDVRQQTVLPATTTSLSVSSITTYFGQPLSMIATVTPSGATGKVTFYDGATMLGIAPVIGGAASLTTPLLASGFRSLHAYYSGSPAFGYSSSAVVTKTINTRAQGGFNPPIMFPTGPSTITSVIGDFNGDGKQDIAVLDYDFNADINPALISIYLGNGDGTLTTGMQYHVGNAAEDLAVGDFNGDGKQDLVLADATDGVVVLTGIGDGTFNPGSPVQMGPNGDEVDSIAVGDFNNDGIADLAYGSLASVSVVLGRGDGTFSLPLVAASTAGPALVKVADMNRDGIADLVWIDGSLNVRLGFGTGLFGIANQYLPPQPTATFALADFNGDHIPDVVVSLPEADVAVYLGIGDGTLGNAGNPTTTFSVGGSPEYVATGDFDGDGKQDVLTADPFTGDFIVTPGLGDGTFGTPVVTSSPLFPSGITIGNFSGGTGRVDVAVANGGTDDLGLLLGLAPAVTLNCPIEAPAVTGIAYSLTCTGSTGVGADVYSQPSGTPPPGLSLNTSTGVISGTPTAFGSYTFRITATDSDVPAQSASVDLTLTVATPLVMAASPLPNGNQNSPYFAPLVSGGTPPYNCSLQGNGPYPTGLAANALTCVLSGTPATQGNYSFTVGAIDAGSPPQLTSRAFTLNIQSAATTTVLTSSINPSANGQSTTLTAIVTPSTATGNVTFNDGGNAIGSPVTLLGGTATLNVSSLTIGAHSLTATYNGDTNDATSTSTAVSQIVLPASTTVLTSNTATPLFGQPVTLTATVTGGTVTGKVTFYDGTVPVGTITTTSGIATLSTTQLGPGTRSLRAYYQGSGSLAPSSGTLSKSINVRTQNGFAAAVTNTAGADIRSVAIADFDGDGIEDIVTGSTSATSIGIFIGHGDGTFKPVSTYNVGSPVLSIGIADFNGDGKLDLVLAAPANNGITILLGNGGVFGAPASFPVPGATGVAVGDFDGDGNSDVAVAVSGALYRLLGNGDGTFKPSGFIRSTSGPTEVAVADFNSDGKTDIVAADDAGTLRVFFGNGDGSFQSPSTYGTGGATPISVIATDLNNDGNPDVVVGTSGGGVRILLGSATGVLGSFISYPAGNVPGFVATGDFDGDGKLDIVTTDLSSASVKVLPGNGDGTFQNAVSWPTATTPYALAVGNFRGGNGRADIVVGYGPAGDIGVLLSQAPPATVTCTPQSVPPNFIGATLTINCLPTGGVAPFSYLTSAGNLPSGLNLNSATGVITGTLTAPGTFTFTIKATDSDSPAQNPTSTLTVIAVTQLTMATTPLPVATVNNLYSTVVASGGTPPYSCGLTTGGYPIGLTLNAGTCVLSGTPIAPGSYTFTVGVSDAGTPQQNASRTFALNVQQITTTTGLGAGGSPNPSGFGQSVTFTASVVPSGATGSVDFKEGSTVLGSGTLNGSGVATFSTSSLSFATHSITAVYSGDTNNAGSTSSPVSQVVNKVGTTTTLTSSPNPSTPGAQVTLTATVAPLSGSTTPTGTVTFQDGGNTIGSPVTLNGSGLAVLNTSALAAGSRSITAIYAGDANDLGSTSSALSQLVKNPTVTVLASSLSPAPAGLSVTFTATVTPASSTGTVNLTDNGSPLGNGTLSNGIATVSSSNLAAGPHAIVATYAGDANDLTSTSTTFTQVVKTITTTTLSASPSNSAILGAGVTLTAAVSPASTGQVTFYNGATVLGTSTISGASATLTTYLLPAGANKLSAYYPGSATAFASSFAGLPEAIDDAPQSGFGPGITYTTDAGPWGKALADFNGDGKTDLVVADYNASTISVFLGTGTGAFGAPAIITTGSSPFAVSTGDFDGDGKMDIAVANLFDNSVSVLLGHGDGNFSTPVTYRAGIDAHPSTIIVADFNGDGFADLATANFEGNNISVLLGAGDGTFGPGTLLPTDIHPTGLVAGDFNGDGNIDLAAAIQTTGNVSILTGHGDGTFDAPLNYPTGGGTLQYIATYDFDHDGHLDLVTANTSTNNISVLLGTGTGAFGAPSKIPVGNAPFSVTTGDFDGDGKIDLAVSNDTDSSVSILSGNGSGGFAPAINYGVGTGGSGSRDIAVADLNGDGISDLIVSDFNSNTVSVLLGLIRSNTVLTSSVNPSIFGQGTTLTATVTPALAAGTVTFLDGAVSLGQVTLGGGSASLATSVLTAGTHTLTAAYSGDTVHGAGISSAVSQTVNQASQTITFDPLPDLVFGTAPFTVSATASSHIPVSFASTSTLVCTVSGTTVTLASAGTCTIQATQSGSTDFTPAPAVNQQFTVTKSPTTTTLTSSPGTSSFGAAVLFTARIAPSNGGGFVTFKDGATQLGNPVSVNSGTATLNLATLSVGSHSLTAVYNGDPNYATSTSSILTQTVNQVSTTATLTSSLSTSPFGTSVTFTATVSPSTASGTITLSDGSTQLGSPVVISGGTATFNLSTLPVGPHSLTASYAGDTNDAASASSILIQTVIKAATNTILTSSANPSAVGQNITISALVSPSTATGTITFFDGATALGSPVSLSGGSAEFPIASLSAGTHSLSASYTGDGSYAASTSHLISTPLNFSAAVAGSIADSTGQGTGFTSRLSGTGTSLAANDPNLTLNTSRGNLTLRSTAADLNGQGNLGVAEFVGVPLAGTGPGGDQDISVSATFRNIQHSQNVDQLGVFIGTGSTSEFRGGSLIFTTPVAFTVQTPNNFDQSLQQNTAVAPSQGDDAVMTLSRTSGVWGFSIQNLTNPAKSGNVAVTQPTYLNGVSSFVAGVFAANPGNANQKAETISAFSVAVGAQTVTRITATSGLTSSMNPSTFGLPITLTAAISPPDATGDVTFNDGAATIGTGTIGNGQATLAIAGLAVGSHSLTAVYGGDVNHTGGTSLPIVQVVNQSTTTLTLTSSGNPSIFGSPIALTASITPVAATGTITFKEGATVLGSSPLSNGTATLNVGSLSAATHSLVAFYNGDVNDVATQSAVLSQTVNFPTLTVSTSSLPTGQAGVAYGPVRLQAIGGTNNYSWSGTGFPAGISLSSDGTVSGLSSVPFTGTVNISLTDTVSHQTAASSLTFTLTAAPQVTISGTSNLGAVAVGGAIAGSFSATGGTPPYIWSLSGAPGGFAVDAKGNVTGTPGQPGDSSFTLLVKDSTPGTPITGSLALTFSAFGLTTTSLPQASTLTTYNATIGAAGGTAPYSFTITGLPGGLSAAGGAISGKAQVPGTFPIGVKASDSKGLTVSASLSLTVTGPGPLQVTSTSLADGTVNQPYSQALNAAGGSPAYTWSQSGGVAPPGLSVTSSGSVFGQPIQPGSYSLGVQVKDTSGGQAVGTVTINILPAQLQITSGSKLPSGIANSPYPGQVLSASGGVAPYTFGLKGSLPSGLSLTDGQITGIPTASGDFSLSLTVTDSASPAGTGELAVSVTIRPNAADLVLSAGSLSFALTEGTSATPSASAVTVSSSATLQALNFSVDASSAPWLTVSGGGSTTPATVSVGLSNAALALTASGSPYSGSVIVTCTSGPCSGKAQSINVSLTVTAPPPQLSLTSSIFSFIASTANPQSSSAALGIQNSGGGKLQLNSVTAGASWITVSSFPSTVPPGPGAAVTITADPGTLPAGYYTSSLTVNTSAGTGSIPVTLLISSEAIMVLGPAGTQFSMPQGGSLGSAAGSFLVSVSSTTGVTYSAAILPGAAWLTGGGSGTAISTSPGTVSFSIDPTAAAALPAGAYYGVIRVTGSGILNTPQDFQVVLNVSPASTPVVPDPQPGGLLFLSASTGGLPAQSIQVYASSKIPLAFQASAATGDGGGWLTISPKSGSSLAGSPATVLASVDSTGLKPGVYGGSINFASGPAVRTVNVTLVVETPLSPIPAVKSGLKPADTPACANAKLVPAPTGLVSNFSAPASWPTPISLKLVDTCGSVIGHGQIVATFSNGDPPLALSPVNTNTGLYSGTWTPRKSTAQTVITAQATASGYSPASVQVSGQVTPNAAPQLVPNGTLDVFNPQVGGGLGPGNIVQIYGTSLATQPISAETLPLPTKVAGTQVLIGGITAPLFYVSPTQVNAQIPFELHAGQQYQVIVSANGALTTPQSIQLNAGAPAVLQFTSGLVIAQHPDGALVSDTAPAAPGEFLVLYMTGLGATDIAVATGDPSPSDPPANVLDTPALTLNDNQMKLLFAGLTPGLVGLYQINTQVPVDLPNGTYNLAVSQKGVVSNTTSLPVKAPGTSK